MFCGFLVLLFGSILIVIHRNVEIARSPYTDPLLFSWISISKQADYTWKRMSLEQISPSDKSKHMRQVIKNCSQRNIPTQQETLHFASKCGGRSVYIAICYYMGFYVTEMAVPWIHYMLCSSHMSTKENRFVYCVFLFRDFLEDPILKLLGLDEQYGDVIIGG